MSAFRMSNAAAAKPPNPPPTICAFICPLPGTPGWELLPTRARSSKSTTAPLPDSQSYLNCNVPRKSPTARCVPVDGCPGTAARAGANIRVGGNRLSPSYTLLGSSRSLALLPCPGDVESARVSNSNCVSLAALQAERRQLTGKRGSYRPVAHVLKVRLHAAKTLTQSPEAVILSPAEIVAAWPTMVARSRCPRAFTRSTQKPVSTLWNVTRSTMPASTSRLVLRGGRRHGHGQDYSPCALCVASAAARGPACPRRMGGAGFKAIGVPDQPSGHAIRLRAARPVSADALRLCEAKQSSVG